MTKDNVIKLRTAEVARRKQAAERQKAYRERQVEIRKGVTGRDNYILAKALAYASQAIDMLPRRWQERSDCEDMLTILAVMVKDTRTRKLMIEDARNHLEGAKNDKMGTDQS
jgi:hypothetical protein